MSSDGAFPLPPPRRRLGSAEREARNWQRRRFDRLHSNLAWQLLGARRRAGLTQQQVADRMRTTRSAISRLESGVGPKPRLTTIENYAQVVGCRIEIVIRQGR